MTAHSVNFTAANIATTNPQNLLFPADPRSKRAEVASRQRFNGLSDSIESEILFQIVHLENISLSKASQLDQLLALNDLESVGADRLRYSKQRAINNVDINDDNDNENTGGGGNGGDNTGNYTNANNYFKLTLQDSFGTLVYAIELEKLQFLSGKNIKSGFPIQLGSKLIVKKGTTVMESVILLTKDKTEYLGGIVPEWNHKDLNKLHISKLQSDLDSLPKDEPKNKKKKT